MSEMAAYILSDIRASEKALKALEKKFSVLTWALVAYIIIQKKKFKKLDEELKEMKHEGE